MTAQLVQTDLELLKLISQADRLAYEQLFNRYWYKLLRYAGKVIPEQEQAEDLVQDVFFSLWERKESLNEIKSVSAYLHGAVRFKGLNYVRANLHRNKYLESLSYFFEEGSNNIQEALDSKELDAIIQTELDKLPPKMREIFVLSRIECLSHKEIAAKLNISDHTVKKQINNSLHHFRLILDERSGSLLAIILAKFFF